MFWNGILYRVFLTPHLMRLLLGSHTRHQRALLLDSIAEYINFSICHVLTPLPFAFSLIVKKRYPLRDVLVYQIDHKITTSDHMQLHHTSIAHYQQLPQKESSFMTAKHRIMVSHNNKVTGFILFLRNGRRLWPTSAIRKETCNFLGVIIFKLLILRLMFYCKSTFHIEKTR